MDAFYKGLQNKATKAEALRQAPVALIQGTSAHSGGDRGSIKAIGNDASQAAHRWAHPYDWAPFILIGNGL
jgi:CHAT domain-containing protein